MERCLRPEAVGSFYKWIRQNVEKNTPWDEFCKQIVLARGESITDGATNFYAIHQDPESLTENTCQAFMGLSIGCAKCHKPSARKMDQRPILFDGESVRASASERLGG